MNRKPYCWLVILSCLYLGGCIFWWRKPPPPEGEKPISLESLNLAQLKERLYSDDADHRVLAADRLVAIHDKDSYLVLKEALRNNKEPTIRSILKVLTLRNDDRFMELLVNLLETTTDLYETQIFQVFNNLNREDLANLLLERLQPTKKPLATRRCLVRALRYARSKRAIEPLINMLIEPPDELSAEVNITLSKITRQQPKPKPEWQKWWLINKDRPREYWLDEALNSYEELLANKESELNKIIAERVALKIELLNIKLEEAKKVSAYEGTVSLLLTAMDDPYPAVKKYAVEQLPTLPADKSKSAITKLTELLKTAPAEVRSAIIIVLGKIGDESLVDMLTTIFTDSSELPAIRNDAIKSLGDIGNPRPVDKLLTLLKDTDSRFDAGIVGALGRLKDRRSIPVLLEYLTMPNKPPEASRLVIDTLGDFKATEGVETLIKFLEDERDRFRWSASNSLGKISDGRAVQPLIKLLGDDFADIRQITADSLGNIGAPAAAPALVKTLLNDKDSRVRELAAKALGKIKDTETLSDLLPGLTDPDNKVVNAVWTTILATTAGQLELMKATADSLRKMKQDEHAAELYQKTLDEIKSRLAANPPPTPEVKTKLEELKAECEKALSTP